jgi:signal transduction histidine kinase
MANLIGNACQHGAAGQPVDVTLSVEGDTAVVAVHNKGPTIPQGQLTKIFEPFRRLGTHKTQSRTSDSVGLGLYIAKTIVSAHQGTLDVTSTEDGTTFTVRLPLRAADLARRNGEHSR